MIIDRKGRLFGLINIVDLIIFILILAFISFSIIRLTSDRLNANNASPVSAEQDMYVTLYSNSVVPEVVDALKVGDKLVANNAFTSAEIVSVEVTPAAYVSTNSDGEAILTEHPLWKDITVVIKDKVNPSNVILKAGNQEVRVNYNFILKTQTVEANCKVRSISFENNIQEQESLEQEEISSPEQENQTEQSSTQSSTKQEDSKKKETLSNVNNSSVIPATSKNVNSKPETNNTNKNIQNETENTSTPSTTESNSNTPIKEEGSASNNTEEQNNSNVDSNVSNTQDISNTDSQDTSNIQINQEIDNIENNNTSDTSEDFDNSTELIIE